MATTAAVHAEIRRFLASDVPEVLAVAGRWGVGKTYTWNLDLQTAQKGGRLQMDRYAYVSLFGLNSLEDLRYAIFESTVAADQIAEGPSHKTLTAGLHWLEKRGRQLAYLVNALPFGKDILQGSKSAFLAVRSQIVCIDDLERRGKGLDLKDVLGLASLLKEQRHCKVVLLLNDQELGEAGTDFDTQLEKVVDVRVTFDPTPEEASKIGLLPGTAVTDLLQGFCPALGIKNIRVIKKIEYLSLRLAAILSDYEPAVLRQAVHTSALFGWIEYQPNEAPTFEFVAGHNSMEQLLRGNEVAQTDQEKSWHSLLAAYEYMSVDSFDEVIVRGIQAGYFDEVALTKAATHLAEQLSAAAQDSSFSAAWDLYHDSFNTTADEVLDRIADAFKRGVNVISPMNLSGTISLFKDLGRPEQAGELLEYYLEHRRGDADLYDLKESVFGSDVKDPDVRAAFERKLGSFVDGRDPKRVLIDIAAKSGWNPGDLVLIQRLTVEDFKRMFKETEGKDLRRLIKGALGFRAIQGIDDATRQMSGRAEQALKEIAQESPLNARRVAKFGIRVDDASS